MSEDFLSYVNNLVKAAKTPVKEHTSKERLEGPKLMASDIDNLKREELKI